MTLLDAACDKFKRRVVAAAKVFCDYGDFIREVIETNIQGEDQVDDLVQAFFVSLVVRPMPESIQNVEGYLYKAIINDIADANRMARRYRSLIRTHAELSRYPDAQKTPYELLVQAEQARTILELIEGRLPCSEGKAVTLRYREYHSVGEAAEKMGVESMTLKGYVCQGLGRIRRLLKNIEAEGAE